MHFKSIITVIFCLFIFSFQSQAFESQVFPVKERVFLRATGSPFIDIEEFDKYPYEAEYTILVFNGGYSGEYELVEYSEVSSARVWLNGELIFGPKDFNKNITYLEKTISLLDVNNLEVEVASQPGSALIINVVGIVHNSPPQITSLPITQVIWPNKYQYIVKAIDVDDDPINFEIVKAPDEVNINPITGIMTWDTKYSTPGEYDVIVKAVDDEGKFDTQEYKLQLVAPSNYAPEIISQPVLISGINDLYEYQVVAIDQDNDELTYSFINSPNGMVIDSISGKVEWNVSQSDFGYHLVQVTVSDGNKSAQQAYNLNVISPNNTAPTIISTPRLEITTEQLYSYQVIATDPEGDSITYELISAPTGMLIDSQSGLVSWSTDLTDLQSFPVQIKASDPSNLSDEQEYQLHLSNVPNTPPEITSSPVTVIEEYAEYIYQVEAIDNEDSQLTYQKVSGEGTVNIDSTTGLLSWSPTSLAPQGAMMSNAYCQIAQDETTRINGFADVFIVVDESGSMGGEHSWISDLVPALESGLSEVGVGQENTNLYGLVGYERSPRFLSTNNELMVPIENFSALSQQLRLYGGYEDGYRAMKGTLDTYPIRSNSARNLILVTDEDRDGSIPDYDTIKSKLVDENVILNAVVNSNFYCDDGASAIGMSAGGNGYVADGQGGYYLCSGAYAQGASGGTIRDYVGLAIETGGAAWNLNFLRSGGLRAQSFSEALVDIKIKEILEQLPPIIQVDLQANQIEITEQNSGVIALSANIFNRGLADTELDYSVSFYSKGELLGVTHSSGLAAGESESLFLSNVHENAIGESISALITSGNDECQLNNNLANAAAIQVEVVDSFNAKDKQWITVNATSVNIPPVIFVAQDSTLEVGEKFSYQLSASDENIGDSILFSLTDVPLGMKINPSSGVVSWQPTASDIGEIQVAVQVTDLSGAQASTSMKFTVLDILKAPVIVSEPILTAQIGASYYYQVVAQSDRNATLTYSLIDAPEGMVINESTGEISWRPTVVTRDGGHTVIVEIVDDKNLTAIQTFNISAITSDAAAEFISTPNTYLELGEVFSYSVEVTEPTSGEIALSLQQAPQGSHLDFDSRTITWTPITAGIYSFQVIATTTGGLQSYQKFDLQVVEERNLPPVITSQVQWLEGDNNALTYQVVAHDPEGESLAYELVEAPAGMSIGSEGLISWPADSQTDGHFAVRIKVTDVAGIFTEQITSSTYYPNNEAPLITSQPIGVGAIGVTYLYTLDAEDADGDPLSFSLELAPENSILNGNEIQWTPSQAQLGAQSFLIKVADPYGAYTTQSFNVTVLEVLNNNAPIITSTPNFEAFAEQLYSYQIIAADPDNNPLTYRLVEAPENMSINNDGYVTWIPNSALEGANAIKLRVFDSYGAYSEQSFNVSVNVGGKPVITSTPVLSAYHDFAYQYQIEITDIDDTEFLYQLTSAPEGMTLSDTGEIAWSPTIDNIGEHLVAFEVKDSVNNVDTQAFNLAVKYQGESLSPVIDSSPKLAAKTEEVYQYQVVASDPDGDALKYELVTAPSGMTVSNSGLLQWLATEEAIGSNDVTVLVSDITGQEVTQSFKVMATAPGHFNRRICRNSTQVTDY